MVQPVQPAVDAYVSQQLSMCAGISAAKLTTSSVDDLWVNKESLPGLALCHEFVLLLVPVQVVRVTFFREGGCFAPIGILLFGRQRVEQNLRRVHPGPDIRLAVRAQDAWDLVLVSAHVQVESGQLDGGRCTSDERVDLGTLGTLVGVAVGTVPTAPAMDVLGKCQRGTIAVSARLTVHCPLSLFANSSSVSATLKRGLILYGTRRPSLRAAACSSVSDSII